MSDSEVAIKERILSAFSFGLDTWLSRIERPEVFARLSTIEENPLRRSQLNQLLHLCHEAGVSEGFFRYYWLSTPVHPYEVSALDKYHPDWIDNDAIHSLDHLRWGVYRLYIDALLFFGDVRTAFRLLRTKTEEDLKNFFGKFRYDTDGLKRRGEPMKLNKIARDDRYLISEMACKSHDAKGSEPSELKRFLAECLDAHIKSGGGKIGIRRLLEQGCKQIPTRQEEFLFSAEDILNEEVSTTEELEAKYDKIAAKFHKARQAALQNSNYFLSMVNDLDVYVATSMRLRDDFRKMSDFCERIFRDPALAKLHLRYFDPTVSAAEGHEDKGLIECLMVKCAKVLVYFAGTKDSFGKDAEASMALALGKPVIFFCDEESRKRIFTDIHPLSRLIQFETGVAVGAMVTASEPHVVELLARLFENRMEYNLERRQADGYLRLREKLTSSVVRLQTSNDMLRETFWNSYHNKV